MSADTGASSAVESKAKLIRPGDTVLLRVPNGDVRSVKVDKDSCALPTLRDSTPFDASFRTVTVGRLGAFHANELIDEPYGFTYEMDDKKLKVVRPRSIQDVGRRACKSGKQYLTKMQRIPMLQTSSSTMESLCSL